MMHDTPHAGVVLADQPCDRGDGHLGHQRHHQCLEQQREPAARPRPRQADLAHAVLWADHPRDPRDEVGLMLEEVQMAPALLAGVVDLTAVVVALGTGKPCAPSKSMRSSRRRRSASKEDPTTRHGSPNPKAVWNNSTSRTARSAHRRHQAREPYTTAAPLPTRNSEGPNVAACCQPAMY